MRIFGNKFALKTFESMFESGRLAHSFLIYGDKGTGKKSLAIYLAQALLCEKNTGIPCGVCRACRNVKVSAHPDLIFPEQSGKLMTYTADTCRKVCTDAHIKPNDGERKVYVFKDCTNILNTAQNTLLKIVEEPPEFVYFIFTAEYKDVFLPTIQSRVVSIPTTACTEDECAGALASEGYDSEQIKKAMKSFGTNVGMCIEYLENDDMQRLTELTKTAADSIINRDEYGLLLAMSAPELKDRTMSVRFFEMLDKLVRDAAVLKLDPESSLIGCSKKNALGLSNRLSLTSANKIHRCLARAAKDVAANVNASVIMPALCGEIMNC